MNSQRCILSWLLIVLLVASFATSRSATTGADRLQRMAGILSTVVPPGERSAGSFIDGKCGFSLNAAIRQHWEKFSPQQQSQLRTLMSPLGFQKVRVIGKFEIFYDTVGSNQPALLAGSGDNIHRVPNSYELYIDSVGKYFNDAWHYEIDTLGYLAPPIQPGHAGYEIDVMEFNTQLYGQTIFDTQLNSSNFPSLWSTHIQLDNDFLNFYSEGTAGLRVTSAHEFHHAIQMGHYGFWDNQNYFYEITSTWMETVVQPAIKDYLQYLRRPNGDPFGAFEHPDLSFTTGNGLIEYSRAIWGKYIEKRFSRLMMRKTWENIRTQPVLTAIHNALADSGSSIQKALLEWSLWNYYTDVRADTVHYYTEGKEYPVVLERDSAYYSSPSGSFVDSLQSLSSVYHPVSLGGRGRIFTITTNVNIAPPGNNYAAQQNFTYRLADVNDGSYSKWVDSLVYVKLDVSDPLNWQSQEAVPGVIPSPPTPPQAAAAILVYPNPYVFNNGIGAGLTFVLPTDVAGNATLLVLTSNMRRIFSGDLAIHPTTHASQLGITWQPSGRINDLPASGIYFYAIRLGDQTYTGKFSIIKQ